jgi:RpiR family carbohydrate utilization transcriptional regulator
LQTAERTDIISAILKKSGYLQPALRRIADYILEHLEECKTITTKRLAAVCEVAESTVTRFVREIGCDSFQELKIAIAEYLMASHSGEVPESELHVFEDIGRTDSIDTIVGKIYHRNVQTLLDTKQLINPEKLSQAAEAIESAELLLFCCMGSSGVAAEEAVMRFSRAGKKCLLNRDESIQSIHAAITTKKDVVIGISNSGRSTSVIRCLKLARQNGAKTIAITSFEDSPIAQHADIALFTSTKNRGTGLDWESTSSKNAQIFIIDILYAVYASRHFKRALSYLDKTYKAIRDTRGK